jgi:phage I-like protein
MATLLINRDGAFEVPADGWYQLSPLGEFPHAQAGVVQVIDAQAVSSIVNRFNAMIANDGGSAWPLVDFDHFSLDTAKPSEAAGWITNMQARADGLWAQIKWSDVGDAAVRGGRYRFLSPVFNRRDCEDLGGGKVRPMVLVNAAVTNDPNIKGAEPLSNREAKGMDYKKQLLNMTGLGDDATDEQIENACGAMREKIANMEKAASDAAASEADKQAEGDMDEMENRGIKFDRAAVKTALLSNRSGTLALFAAVKVEAKPPSDGGNLPNRSEQTTPDNGGGLPGGRQAAREAYVDEVRIANRCDTRAAAWAIAEKQKPELFA